MTAIEIPIEERTPEKALATFTLIKGAGGSAANEPGMPDNPIGMLAWTKEISDHAGNPVGGLVVDVGMTEAGENCVFTIEARGADTGPQPWRIRRIPVSAVILPLDPQSTNQLISWSRHIAGWIKARGKASDIVIDIELRGYLEALHGVINGG